MRLLSPLAFISLFTIQLVSPLAGAPATFGARHAIELSNPIVTLADINNDGHPDIIAAVGSSGSGDFQVSLQLGSGTGTFSAGPSIDLGPGFVPTAIATGDFNGDGLLDIAVLSSGSHALYVLTQQFQGFNITPIQIAEDTTQTLNLAVADMNGDRFPDIIIPSAVGAVVLLSSRSGTFKTPILADSIGANFVIAADLNGDKKQDLVLSGNFNCCSGTAVTVLLGDGHGGFNVPLSQPPISSITSRIAVADFNKDGKLDIAAVTYFSPGSVLIATGNGDGTFAAPYSFSLPAGAGAGTAIAAGDLNGDGAADLLVLATYDNGMSLFGLLNEGKGTFGPASSYPVEYNANVIALGNLNSDTYLDALVSTSGQGSTVSLLFNTGKGSFEDGQVVTTKYPPSTLVPGDFFGDGKLDLVSLDSVDGLTVFLNTGNNTSLFSPLPSLPYYTGLVVGGDFNDDGKDDLVIVNNAVGETLIGKGNGTFYQESSSFNTLYYATSAVAADMNGDGKLDIVTSAPSINLGNGDGTFRTAFAGYPNYCYGAAKVAVADFNRDGKPDVVVSCEGIINLYLGNGDGTTTYPVFSYYSSVQSLAVEDFNRDGIPDIAFTSTPDYYAPASTEVTILIGQGNGSFATGITMPVLSGQVGLLVAGEFDGNGVMDLAIVDDIDSVFSILRGNGDGTFQLPELFGTATLNNTTCVVDGKFRSGSQRGEQDLAFCAGQGIALNLNTTR